MHQMKRISKQVFKKIKDTKQDVWESVRPGHSPCTAQEPATVSGLTA